MDRWLPGLLSFIHLGALARTLISSSMQMSLSENCYSRCPASCPSNILVFSFHAWSRYDSGRDLSWYLQFKLSDAAFIPLHCISASDLPGHAGDMCYLVPKPIENDCLDNSCFSQTFTYSWSTGQVVKASVLHFICWSFTEGRRFDPCVDHWLFAILVFAAGVVSIIFKSRFLLYFSSIIKRKCGIRSVKRNQEGVGLKETVAHLPNRCLIETRRVQHATCCTTQLCRPFSLPSFYQPRYHTFGKKNSRNIYTTYPYS